VLSRFEPDDDPQGSWAFDSLSLCQYWKVKCAGRTLASKASGILTDVWIETYRLPPILEREPGRDRGLSGKQTVSRAACDSGSPRSAILGSVLVARYGSPKPGSRVQLLAGPPSYSGVGCWHPSCALNAAHAGPIPAA
jgi:hypothetical protein